MKTSSLAFVFVLTLSCYQAKDVPPDQQIWEYDDPGNVALSEQTLLILDSAISADFFQRIEGLIIIKDDKLVFENYYVNDTRNAILPQGSASIALTIAALGVALEKRLIELDDPIHSFLPEYSALFEAEPEKKEITIKHLLTHRSGIAWNESIVAINENPDNNLNQMLVSQDWVAFILDRPQEAPPGLRYNFNSGTGTILAKVIENSTGQRFDEFLRTNILEIIGISTFSIGSDPAGNQDGGRGASMNLLDWTKFGYLMLNEGIWKGRRILDPNFILESTSLQVSIDPSTNLGYGWSLFGDSFTNSFAISKDDIYFVYGELGQHLYVIPSYNMIVAISAENFFFNFNFTNPSLNLFAQITTSIQ